MNKNIENYKNTYSALRPSDEAIERAMNMTNEKQKVIFKLTYKRLAAAVLALVLFIGGGFGINHFTNESNNFTVLVAYADSPEYVSAANEQGLFGALYVAPVNDEKKYNDTMHRYCTDWDKISTAAEKTAKEGSSASLSGGLGPHDIELPSGDVTAKYWIIRAGHFALNLDDYADVQSFKIENISPYIYLNLENPQFYEKMENDWYGRTEEEWNAMMDEELLKEAYSWAHAFEMTGEEIRDSPKSGYFSVTTKKHKVTNYGYFLSWEPSTELFNAIAENPDFDLSQIKDTITFTVTFNDGSVKTASLNLYFDKDGYMHFE